MKMFCKACGKRYYVSENSYNGYPYGSGYWSDDINGYVRAKVPPHQRVFHSRNCWEYWTAQNIDAYILWLQGVGNNDTNVQPTNRDNSINETIEERNNYG